ncbi:MAG: restriction endonuclease subunit S [Spirochaetae bacterium HGW-Spirochaetae-5]|nr:MAG: restriction endonuclease subunit S [Spirochaetae bacterium HGW-Spirochaetae-5]
MRKHHRSKLGDLVQITGGGTPSRLIPEYWDGEIPWVSVKDFISKRIVTAQEKITLIGLKNSASNLIPAESILMPTRMGLGKIAINDVPVAINQDIKALHIKEINQLDINYLFLYLSSISKVFEKAGKGATVKGFKLDFLKDIEVPLPPLSEQIKIASILTRAENLIAKRKESIKSLDEFLKSTFLEMFGDPVRNDKGWEKKYLKNLTIKIGSGATPTGGDSSYKTEGISLIRSMNVYDNTFKYKDLAYIDEVQADKLKNVIVEIDDVLLNITGASVCRCTLVPKDILPARVNQHVAIIRVNRKELNSIYLTSLFTLSNYKFQLLKIAKQNGATREALTKDQIENLEILLPPLPIQNKFAVIVEKVQAIKVKYNESLVEMEKLYGSLSQRAFRGEL